MQNTFLSYSSFLFLHFVFCTLTSKCAMSVSTMLFDSRMLFATFPPDSRRAGNYCSESSSVRQVIFAPLLCIIRQLYIVSYLDFRHGKCAVIYCFANGRATFTFTCSRSFLFHFKEHTCGRVSSEYPLRHFAFLSYFASLCCLFECLARRGPSSFSTQGTLDSYLAAIKHCHGGYEISIFPLLFLPRACVVFRIGIYVSDKMIGLGNKAPTKKNRGEKTKILRCLVRISQTVVNI